MASRKGRKSSIHTTSNPDKEKQIEAQRAGKTYVKYSDIKENQKYAGLTTSVLISKVDMYLIDVAEEGVESIRYRFPYTPTLGAKALAQAIEGMQDPNPSNRKRFCEVLFVHICEAVRFKPIEHQICRGFKSFMLRDSAAEDCPLPIPDLPDPCPWFQRASDEEKRREVSNLMSLEGVVIINMYDGLDTFASLEGLIKNWEDLSKAWVLYAATGGQHFDVAGHNILLEKGKIGCCQSLG